MLNAVIVDDIKLNADGLKKDIEKLASDKIKVAHVVYTYGKALEILLTEEPDVVFLDIELDGGHDAFELLEKLKTRNFELIFCTAHVKYALKAFEFGAVHYITKPIDKIELLEAIGRVIKNKKEHVSVPNQQLMMIKSKEKIFITDVKNIICISTAPGQKNKIKIRLHKDNKYESYILNDLSVTDCKKIFSKYKGFYAVSQSEILNLEWVEYIEDGIIVVKGMERDVYPSKDSLRTLKELIPQVKKGLISSEKQ